MSGFSAAATFLGVLGVLALAVDFAIITLIATRIDLDSGAVGRDGR